MSKIPGWLSSRATPVDEVPDWLSQRATPASVQVPDISDSQRPEQLPRTSIRQQLPGYDGVDLGFPRIASSPEELALITPGEYFQDSKGELRLKPIEGVSSTSIEDFPSFGKTSQYWADRELPRLMERGSEDIPTIDGIGLITSDPNDAARRGFDAQQAEMSQATENIKWLQDQIGFAPFDDASSAAAANAGGSVLALLSRGGESIGIVPEGSTDDLIHHNQWLRQAISGAHGDSAWGQFEKHLSGAEESLIQTYLVRRLGPGGIITYHSMLEANQAVTDGRDAGLKGKELAAYIGTRAANEGVTTAVFQKLNKFIPGVGGLEAEIGKKMGGEALKSALKRLPANLIGELTEEEVITIGGYLLDQKFEIREGGTEQLLQEMEDTAYQTILAVGVGQGTNIAQRTQFSPESIPQSVLDRHEQIERKRDTRDADVLPEVDEANPQQGIDAHEVPQATPRPVITGEKGKFQVDTEQVQSWVTENPEVAAEVSQADKLSRGDLEKLPNVSTGKSNAESRKEFQAEVQAILAEPIGKSEPIAPTTPADPEIDLDNETNVEIRRIAKAAGIKNVGARGRKQLIAMLKDLPSLPGQQNTLPISTTTRTPVQASSEPPTQTDSIPVETLARTTEGDSGAQIELPPQLEGANNEELRSFIKGMGGKPPRIGIKDYKIKLRRAAAEMAQQIGMTAETQATPQTVSEIDESTPYQISRQPVDRRAIQNVFPGTSVVELSNKRGYRIEFAGGQWISVEPTSKIDINWKSVEAQEGRTFTAAERAAFDSAAGAWVLSTKEGQRINGLGLMRLHEQLADDGTVRHESLHFARSAGLFSPKEWNALVREHSSRHRSQTRQEEDIAKSREAWEGDKGLLSRIKAWLNGLLSKLELATLDAKTVQMMMDTPQFWMRSPTRQQQKETFQLRPTRNDRDLAIPATDPAARKQVAEVDQRMESQGEPGVVRDSDVQSEATSRLQQNGLEAEKKAVHDAARNGDVLGNVGTVVAKQVIDQVASEAISSGDADAILDAQRLIRDYRKIRSEVARELRQGFDPNESPAQRNTRTLQEAVLSPSQKSQEKINKNREAASENRKNNRDKEAKQHDEVADSIEKEWAEQFETLRKNLLLLGVDLSDLNALGYDKNQSARALVDISTAKADRWDAAYEYWRNSILSAPATHAANILSTAAFYPYRATVERVIEAGINTLAKRPDGAQIGEMKHLLTGIMPGLIRGAKNFAITYREERSSLKEQLGRDTGTRYEGTPNLAISGKKGRIIRTPQRLLAAMDDFMQSLVTNMEVGAMAYRRAKAQNLSGHKLEQFIYDQTNDLQSDSWGDALEQSKIAVFQQEGGKVNRGIKKAALTTRRNVPGFGFVFPFVNTLVNIADTGASYTPLGLYHLTQVARQPGKPQLANMMARQAMSTFILLALLSNDEDDPWITGTVGEFNTGERDTRRRMGRQSQSIKIGSEWYSYSRIEPFATAIGMYVDTVNALKSGSTKRVVLDIPRSVSGQAHSKTMLAGLSDVLRAVNPSTMEDGAPRWASNFAASWVPNIIRSASRNSQENYSNRRVWGRDNEFLERVGKRTIQKTELGIIEDLPPYDIWGQVAKRPGSPVPGTDWLWRMTVPINVREEDVFVGDRVIFNWNLQNPDDKWNPTNPSPAITIDGENRHMTDQEYAQYTRIAGEISRHLALTHKLDPIDPTESDREAIKGSITQGRKLAREALLAQWNGGPATEINVAKVARENFQKQVRAKQKEARLNRPASKASRHSSYQQTLRNWRERREEARAWLEKRNLAAL